MITLSSQEKEEKIISTILCCNNLLSINVDKKLKYRNNMMQLFESISGVSNITNEFLEKNNLVKYDKYHNNVYAYLKDVKSLLENNDLEEISLIKNLNENLLSLSNEFTIDNFKIDLSKYINNLAKSNDFDYLDALSPLTIKTKIFAKQPINVNGFDIINSFGLQKELKNEFNLDIDKIFSIIYDKSNKQLLFVFEGIIITYVVENNSFGEYNKIWEDTWNGNIEGINEINTKTYISFINENINANILVLYTNPKLLAENFSYSDNLYNDIAKKEVEQTKYQYRMENFFFKTKPNNIK